MVAGGLCEQSPAQLHVISEPAPAPLKGPTAGRAEPQATCALCICAWGRMDYRMMHCFAHTVLKAIAKIILNGIGFGFVFKKKHLLECYD